MLLTQFPVLPELGGAILLASTPLVYYWHLPLLIVIISLVYSATRFEEWGLIFREALRWGIRLFFFLLVIAVVLFLASSFI